jgi:hypothetical protein
MPKSAIGPGDQDRLSCECGFHQSVLQVVKSPPDKTASTRRRSRGAPLDSPREIPSARRAQAPLSCTFDSVGGERDRAHGARSVPARRRSYEHPRPRAARRGPGRGFRRQTAASTSAPARRYVGGYARQIALRPVRALSLARRCGRHPRESDALALEETQARHAHGVELLLRSRARASRRRQQLASSAREAGVARVALAVLAPRPPRERRTL